MTRYVRGITLTPEERAQAGYTSMPDARVSTGSGQTATGLVKAHACQVTLRDGNACSVTYARHGPRAHRFAFGPPLCRQLWINDRLDGGVPAVEQKAQEAGSQAFRLAQKAE